MLYRVDCKGLLPLITTDRAYAERIFSALYHLTGNASMRTLTRDEEINEVYTIRCCFPERHQNTHETH